jgi:hypothetical protein
MRKSQLETALRAAAQACGQSDLVLAGSQSVYAHTDDVPVEVLASEECDVWAKGKEEKLVSIADGFGKGSPYHLAHGVFVDPVEPGLVLLPTGWENRLKPLRVGQMTAWCLDVNDLVVSKLNAGRLKDYEFINAVLRSRLADFDVIVKRIETFPDLHQRVVLLARLRISSERMP